MKNSRSLTTIALLICLLSGLIFLSFPVDAANYGQDATPQTEPSEISTLSVNLYSQTATPGLDGSVSHTVLEGQALYNIVDLYGITLQELLALNDLTEESIIQPGDILIVVKGGELELGLGTLTPEMLPPEITPSPSPTAETLEEFTSMEEKSIEATPIPQPGFFERVFSSGARFLALGVLVLVLFGVVLLVISSKRMQ